MSLTQKLGKRGWSHWELDEMTVYQILQHNIKDLDDFKKAVVDYMNQHGM